MRQGEALDKIDIGHDVHGSRKGMERVEQSAIQLTSRIGSVLMDAESAMEEKEALDSLDNEDYGGHEQVEGGHDEAWGIDPRLLDGLGEHRSTGTVPKIPVNSSEAHGQILTPGNPFRGRASSAPNTGSGEGRQASSCTNEENMDAKAADTGGKD